MIPFAMLFDLRRLIACMAALSVFGAAAAPLPVRTYRSVDLPSALMKGNDFKIDDHGNVYTVTSVASGRFSSVTDFIVYRPGRDHGKNPGIQHIPGPVTPWMGAYSLIDVNTAGQFICSESSAGYDHRFVWNGQKFIELQPPPPYDKAGAIQDWPELYFSDRVYPTSIQEDGTIWGVATEIMTGNHGGEVRWNLGSAPVVTHAFHGDAGDPVATGWPRRSERGAFLRYALVGFGKLNNIGLWDGYSDTVDLIPGLPLSRWVAFNDANEIVGVDFDSGQTWIYLPQPKYGLSSGFHPLGGDRVSDQPLFSNSGHIIVPTANPDAPRQVWRSRIWYKVDVRDEAGNDAGMMGIYAVNGLGSAIAFVGAHDIGGAIISSGIGVITPDDLAVTSSVTPNPLTQGEEFALRLDIRNNSEITLTKVGIVVSSMYFTGAIIADWTKAPAALLTLAPGKSGTLHYGYKTKALGTAQIRFQVEGLNQSGVRAALTEGLSSPQIAVVEPLSLSFSTTTNRFALGDVFEVRAFLRNNLTTPVHSVQIDPPKLSFDGNGEIQWLSGPEPAVAPNLAAGASQEVVFMLYGTKPGTVTVLGSARALKVNEDAIATSTRRSDEIAVDLAVDLAARRAGDLDSEAAGLLEYKDAAVPSQTADAETLPGQAASFDVFVVNRGSKPTEPIVRVNPGTSPHWAVAVFTEAGADITDAVRSPGGWAAPKIEEQEGVTLTAKLTPSPAAVGTEFYADFRVSTKLAPDWVGDVARTQASAQDMILELDQESAVVGNVVTASLYVRNPYPATLKNVSAGLDASASAIATNDVAPPSVASLPPGSVALFKRPFAMVKQGKVEFTGRVTAERADGTQYTSPTATKALTNGILTLLASELIQVLPGVPLVQSKPAVIGLTISNSTSRLQPIELKLDVDTDYTPEQDDPLRLTIGSIVGHIGPGRRTITLPTPTNKLVRVKILADGSGKLKLSLFPSTATWVPPYTGQTLETNYTSQFSTDLDYRFSNLTFDPAYQIPSVSAANAAILEKADGPFLVACYPMAPHGPRLPVIETHVGKGLFASPTWEQIMRFAERGAISAGVDRMIVVFPDHHSVWPKIPGLGDAAGWAFRAPHPIKHVVSIVETNTRFAAAEPSTSAHEIGHTFGFDDVPHPTATSVHEMFWVERDIQNEDVYDLMDYASPAWINENHYRALLSEFAKFLLDPDVILVSGTIGQNGSVVADPWYSITANEASEPAADGTHAVEFWDAGGHSLARFPFTPGFVADAYPVTLPAAVDDTSMTLDSAPFVFAIPRPARLARITVAKGGQVLLERAVSPHPPRVQVLSPRDGDNYATGEPVPIRWNAQDEDGDPIHTAIQFSPDGGASWHGVTMDLAGGEFEFQAPDISTSQGVLRLQITDGMNTTEVLSPRFRIQGTTGGLIASAGPRRTAAIGEPVVLDGSGSHDPAGGPVQLSWRIAAEPDGPPTVLNDGQSGHPSFTPMREGRYSIRVVVTSGDASAVASTTVIASGVVPPRLRVAILAGSTLELRWSAASAGYRLHSAASVAGSTAWSAVEANASVDAGDFVVRIPLQSSDTFFRLVNE